MNVESLPWSPAPGGEAPQPANAQTARGRLVRRLPGVAVLAIAIGLAAWGHHSGWKLPSRSTAAAASSADDWCAAHLVPESQCVECDPKQLPPPHDFGWCREHGVPQCVTCHPELAQVEGRPRLPQYDTVAALKVMERPANNSQAAWHRHRVQLASAEVAERAGIEVDVVAERSLDDVLASSGEIAFDPTRVAHLSPRVAGSVHRVYRTLGDDVVEGEILALIDAKEVGELKGQLVQAVVQCEVRRAHLDQLREASSAIAGRVLLEAEAALREAMIARVSAAQSLVNLGFEAPDELDGGDPLALSERLRFLGLPGELAERVSHETRTANLIPLAAPFDAVVVEADVVAGEVVSPSDVLYTLAQRQRMWLLLAVRQEDARHLAPGMLVEFDTEDGQDRAGGPIQWISPVIDPHTRTIQVRVVLDNPQGQLRDRTFGTGRIIVRREPQAVSVPLEAVQSTGDAQVVFVRDKDYLRPGSPKVFHVRVVRTGASDGRYVELLAGALPGEVVASQGAAVLLGQLLRSNLGAGCGCHEQ